MCTFLGTCDISLKAVKLRYYEISFYPYIIYIVTIFTLVNIIVKTNKISRKYDDMVIHIMYFKL